MNGPRGHYAKQNKSEKEMPYDIMYTWNLKQKHSAEAEEELTTATPPWSPGQWEDWAGGKTRVLGSGYGLGAAQAKGVCAEGSGDSAQPSALCPFSASWREAGG